MQERSIFEEPLYPIYFRFEDGEVWRFDDAANLGVTLKTWDTRKDSEQIVFDALGRPVDLEVESLAVKRLNLQ